jgi:hypothetical protein
MDQHSKCCRALSSEEGDNGRLVTLHQSKLHNSAMAANQEVRSAGHAARTAKMINAYKVLAGTLKVRSWKNKGVVESKILK